MINCYDWHMPNVTGEPDELVKIFNTLGVAALRAQAAVGKAHLPKEVRDRFNSAMAQLAAATEDIEKIRAGTWQAERIDGRCSWCLDPMTIPDRYQGGGRTKRFCSSACRVAHHRWRNDPASAPDRQTWIINNRPGLHQEQ